jgi:hypothetical protein
VRRPDEGLFLLAVQPPLPVDVEAELKRIWAKLEKE